jgi:hypothetical protein
VHPVQGAQVFIKYGQHTNDTLLLYYGFVEPGIPHDIYVVSDLAAAAAAAAAAAGVAAPSVELPVMKARSHDQNLWHSDPESIIRSVMTFWHVFDS